MSHNYKAQYIITGMVYYFKAANFELAWQKATEMFKEELLRELLPTFSNNPEIPISFNSVRTCDYIRVELLDQYKIIVYGDNGIDVIGCMKNPLIRLLEEGFDFKLKADNIEIIDNWLVEQFEKNILTSFEIELVKDPNDSQLVNSIKIIKV